MKYMFLGIGLGLLCTACTQQITTNENLIETLLRRHPDKFENLLDSSDQYEIQILYTQIDRDENNTPSFRSFHYNVDSLRYFYPASTVKFPLVLMALEKLNQLHVAGLDRDTPMLQDSVYSGHLPLRHDSSSATGMPSIAHYTKKNLIVSDNDAYNRLYAFVGQAEIKERLRYKNYFNTRITHRLERPQLSLEENARTEPVRFVKENSNLYAQSMLVNLQLDTPIQKILKGRGYIKDNTLVPKPFEFTYKNFFPLEEQQRMLKSVVFPEAVPSSEQFELTPNDRAFVLKYMSQLPTETLYPSYFSDSTYTDAYCKFFMYGGKGGIPKTIRIFNKVGDGYGYLIDNAYIIDFEHGVEFMLSAVIHVNADGIYNDNVYEYEKIGFPFFRNLGNIIYQYELTRKRKYKPNLNNFKYQYDYSRTSD